MPQTPIRLLEKALTSDVLIPAVIPELDGLTVFPGLSADDKVLPRLHCVVTDADPAGGFEGLPETQEYTAQLYLGFIRSAKGASVEDLDAYDAQIAAVHALFVEPPADGGDGGGIPTLRGLLNKPAGVDGRTVTDLYIYPTIHFAGQSQDPLEDKGQWQVLLRYQVQFKPTDGASPTP